MNQFTEKQIAKGLNEWMRRYVEEPERFEHELNTVRNFVEDEKTSDEPRYGVEGAAYLAQIIGELEA